MSQNEIKGVLAGRKTSAPRRKETHTIERKIVWYRKSGRDIDTCRCISAQELHSSL